MDNNVKTHSLINPELCGQVHHCGEGRAEVAMLTTQAMAVDSMQLVHGGFVFGLADHAAMLAVNEPTVVLGSSSVRFNKPVRVGEELLAQAEVGEVKGKKREVTAKVWRGEDCVLEGSFTCFVLDKHVLA